MVTISHVSAAAKPTPFHGCGSRTRRTNPTSSASTDSLYLITAREPRQGRPLRRGRLRSALSEPTRKRDLGWSGTCQRRPRPLPAEDVQADPDPRRDRRTGVPPDSSSLGDLPAFEAVSSVARQIEAELAGLRRQLSGAKRAGRRRSSRRALASSKRSPAERRGGLSN